MSDWRADITDKNDKHRIAELERENAELKAHVSELRGLFLSAKEWDSLYVNLIDSRIPAQSLAAHDARVREKCAKVCDSMTGRKPWECAEAIRKME